MIASSSTTSVTRDIQRVRDTLWKFPVLRAIQVEERNGSIVLRGTLSSFYHKQLCISGALPLLGRRALEDQIQVADGA